MEMGTYLRPCNEGTERKERDASGRFGRVGLCYFEKGQRRASIGELSAELRAVPGEVAESTSCVGPGFVIVAITFQSLDERRDGGDEVRVESG